MKTTCAVFTTLVLSSCGAGKHSVLNRVGFWAAERTLIKGEHASAAAVLESAAALTPISAGLTPTLQTSPCGRHLTFDDDVRSTLKLTVDSEDSVVLTNTGDQCVDGLSLDDGKQLFRIGAVSFDLLLEDILKQSDGTQRGNLDAVWRWTSDSFTHYCSFGSPGEGYESSSRMMNHIYSFSFGCCSDTNLPIMPSLLVAAGVPTQPLIAPLHTSDQALLDDGTQLYVDADHKVVLPGNVPNLPTYYSKIFAESELEKENSYPPTLFQRQYVGPLQLVLAPGDRLEFTNQNIDAPLIVRSPYTADNSSGFFFPETDRGTAHIALAPYALGNWKTTASGALCGDFAVPFPFMMLSASVGGLTETGSVAFAANGVKARAKAQAFPGDEIGKVPLTIPLSKAELQVDPLQANVELALNFAWGRYDLPIRVCDNELDVAPLSLDIVFQYNHRIFPADVSRLRLVNPSSVTFDRHDFRTDQAMAQIGGRCPTSAVDAELQPGKLDPNPCLNGKWSGQVSLKLGVNMVTFSADTEHGPDSATIAIDYDPSPGLSLDTFGGNAAPSVSSPYLTLEGSCVSDTVNVVAVGFLTTQCVDHRWSQAIQLNAPSTDITVASRDIAGHPVSLRTINVKCCEALVPTDR